MYSDSIQEKLDTIVVGSFIRAYHDGVHKVTGIRKAYDITDYLVKVGIKNVGDPLDIPQVQYVKVMSGRYKEPAARRRNECDIRIVELVDAKFVTELQATYRQRIQNLTDLLLGNWEVANSV